MRLTVNYDIVFLTLLGHNYEDLNPVFEKGHCPVHPLVKVEYVKNDAVAEKVCDVSAILGYYKACDNAIDERGKGAAKTVLKRFYRKAAKRLPRFDAAVKSGYEKLRGYELQGADINITSECFGSALMAAGDAVTDKCDRNLRELLFYVGKWIYVIDALDDVAEDFEKHNFNPFLRDVKCLDDIFYDELEKKGRMLCYDCIDRITAAYNSMNIAVSEGALSNIVYRGFKSRTEKIIGQRGKKCRKIRL
jgi:hypothetical protein